MSRSHCVIAALLAASCATSPSAPTSGPVEIERSDVLALGEAFDSSMGGLHVISVQDEFHVVRCADTGPIAGCFDTIFTVPREQVRFNRWLPVPAAPGLDVALVTPTRVAFQIRPQSGAKK